MYVSAGAMVRAVAALMTDERIRKRAGWTLAVILSPIILLAAVFCSILGGSADHNNSILDLCFYGGTLPSDLPEEYRAYIADMQASFALLDEYIAEINSMTEEEASLDSIRVKAIFYALHFGADSPSSRAHRQFADCFVTYEERTRTITETDDSGNEVEQEETYTVAVPITDMETVWANIQSLTGTAATQEQRDNADSIYNLIRYGASTGTDGWIPGAEVPFVGADGFCSPVGSDWESRVTSEFGYRSDPFTGQSSGHTGIDIAVPTGTPVRAALPGVVTTATYNAGGYGYYVKIDHGNGMVTLYAHNSKLLVKAGDTVEAGIWYRCPAPPAGLPVPICTLRCVSTASASTREPICLRTDKEEYTMKENEMTVLKVEPGKPPEKVTIPNTLKAMQEMVGGYIEVVYLDDICLVCNEEGKLMGLEGNRRVGGDIIAGTFFLAGDNRDGDFCSLTQEQLERFGQMFAQPESIQPGEVEETMRIEFYSM